MKYRVLWDEVIACEAIVEANSEAEAIEMTYNLDPGELKSRQYDRRAHDECELIAS